MGQGLHHRLAGVGNYLLSGHAGRAAPSTASCGGSATARVKSLFTQKQGDVVIDDRNKYRELWIAPGRPGDHAHPG
jgi:hypothetical protein